MDRRVTNLLDVRQIYNKSSQFKLILKMLYPTVMKLCSCLFTRSFFFFFWAYPFIMYVNQDSLCGSHVILESTVVIS